MMKSFSTLELVLGELRCLRRTAAKLYVMILCKRMIKSCKKRETDIICSVLCEYMFLEYTAKGPRGGMFQLLQHTENESEELRLRTSCYRSLILSTKKLSKMLYSSDHSLIRLQLTSRNGISSSCMLPAQALVL